MKQLKRTPYFLVSGIFLFLSCQTEEIPVTENRQKQTRQVTKVSFSTFKKQTGLVDFKTTFEIPKSSNGAISQRKNNGYTPADFIIDTKEITQTIAGEKTSYVFPITPVKGEIEDKRFYLIVYNKDGKWLEMIIQADYSVDKDGDASQTGFKEIYSSSGRGLGCTIIYSWVLKCNGRGECAGGVCDKCSICLRGFADRLCPPINKQDYYDGGFTKPGGNGGGGGGGGGSSNPNPNPETNPNPDPRPEVIIELPLPGITDTPCQQLKKLLEDDPDNKQLVPNIKPQILWLQELVDKEVEYGVEIKKVVNINDSMVYKPTRVESESNSEVILNIGRRIMGWLHSHPKNVSWGGMFSFKDIMFLREAYEETAEDNKDEVFTIIVTRDKTDTTKINTYALKVNDIAALGAKIDAILNKPEYLGMPEKEKLYKIHFDQVERYQKSANEYEKSFLQQFSGAGIVLYKANEDLTGWNKLDLKANPDRTLGVSSTPCN